MVLHFRCCFQLKNKWSFFACLILLILWSRCSIWDDDFFNNLFLMCFDANWIHLRKNYQPHGDQRARDIIKGECVNAVNSVTMKSSYGLQTHIKIYIKLYACVSPIFDVTFFEIISNKNRLFEPNTMNIITLNEHDENHQFQRQVVIVKTCDDNVQGVPFPLGIFPFQWEVPERHKLDSIKDPYFY